MAKLLSQCLAVLKGEEEVKDLWTRSGVCWDDLGMQRENLEEFLEGQVRVVFFSCCFVFPDNFPDNFTGPCSPWDSPPASSCQSFFLISMS